MPIRLLVLAGNPVSARLAEWLAGHAIVRQTSGAITAADVGAVDLVVSYGYRRIIQPDVLSSGRFVNLHISFLPFNRGADPNAWSHLDGTPSGVSIHQIDTGIDTGPILVQRQIAVSDHESLRGTYDRLQEEIQDLFRENWKGIRDSTIKPIPQEGPGTHHYSREFAAIRDRLLGDEGWGVDIRTFKNRWKALRSSRDG